MIRRLLLSYLILVLGTVGVLGVSVYYITQRTFSRYLSNQAHTHGQMLPTLLAGYYTHHNSWDGVQTSLDEASLLIGAPIVLRDAQQRRVATAYPEGGPPFPPPGASHSLAVVGAGGTVLGQLQIGRSPGLRRTDEVFLTEVGRALLGAGVAVGLLAMVFGMLLARSISQPLAVIGQAAAQIARGHYEVQVPLQGTREIVTLAESFNQMAHEIGSVARLRRDLVANVSHDLRTPLTVVRGYLEGLRSGTIADRRSAERAFEAMHSELTRLLDMIDNMRQAACLEQGSPLLHPQPTAILELVGEALDRIVPLATDKGVAITTEVPADLPMVMVDRLSMARVFLNLLDNAIRHTPPSGQIVVRAGRVASANGPSMPHPATAWLWVTVEDTGDGIPSDQLAHIWERFYRGDQARNSATGGVGLGLFIVRSIVEAHHGTIEAESTGLAGQGSTFTFFLPLTL